MKADKITVQYAVQDLISHRQCAEYLAAWKWCLKEKTTLDVLPRFSNFFPEHSRQEHEVVILNPY